jgi:thiamine biosynthesis lipoprotein
MTLVVKLNRLVKTGLLALFLVVYGCDSGPRSTLIEGATMGTTYHIKVVSDDEVDRRMLKQEIDGILISVNDAMSTYQSDSELSIINRSEQTTFTLSLELTEVLVAAFNLCEQAPNYYDVTIGPLVNLWGFGPSNRTNTSPTEAEVTEALSRVGCERAVLNGQRLTRPVGMYIDLSSIAKGYGIDLVAQGLEKLGYSHYMVEIGGEVLAKGRNERGRIWTIGVERPSTELGAPMFAIALESSGLATSGDYRNFFIEGEQRYGHTISPRTGYPIQHNTLSVTVLAATAMQADAWATALNSAGVEVGIEIATDLDLAAFFIYAEDGELQTLASPVFTELTEQ